MSCVYACQGKAGYSITGGIVFTDMPSIQTQSVTNGIVFVVQFNP